MARVLAFRGFCVNVYIIFSSILYGVLGIPYMALSGSVRGFNRSWMDLSTKRFTNLREGIRGVV